MLALGLVLALGKLVCKLSPFCQHRDQSGQTERDEEGEGGNERARNTGSLLDNAVIPSQPVKSYNV